MLVSWHPGSSSCANQPTHFLPCQSGNNCLAVLDIIICYLSSQPTFCACYRLLTVAHVIDFLRAEVIPPSFCFGRPKARLAADLTDDLALQWLPACSKHGLDDLAQICIDHILQKQLPLSCGLLATLKPAHTDLLLVSMSKMLAEKQRSWAQAEVLRYEKNQLQEEKSRLRAENDKLKAEVAAMRAGKKGLHRKLGVAHAQLKKARQH